MHLQHHVVDCFFETLMKELHKRILTAVALWLFIIYSLLMCPPWVFALFILFLLAIILITEWPHLVKPNDPYFWFLTPFYPILPFALIIYMQLNNYEAMNILLLSLVATFDSGSYLIGKKWGHHKINSSISPGKTWEGFIGGILLAFITSLVFFAHKNITTLFTIILPFIFLICAAALCGDLFESYLKRRAGLKDSGIILPGHGGLLDRIDGIMFAAPIVFLARHYLQVLLS